MPIPSAVRSFVSVSFARSRRLLTGLALPALVVGMANGAGRARSQDAPTAPVPPAYTLPPSSLLDFNTDADPQRSIARHGFMAVGGDGHFRYEDGTRARFWGINVSSTRLDIPNEQIEQTVATFARAGLNMVRLEAIDNRNCLLGSVAAPDSLHFDLRYLDRLDFWMDCLRRHGMHYYLDLLDFRTFKAGDGVLNAERLDRGARPYALFDRYLIQLQKDYASRLLLHRNPYSNLMPVDDPALALVEMCNEHGFFIYPEKLETLVEPYRSNLRTLWSQWLTRKYGGGAGLEAAWGSINGIPVLTDGEDPDNNSVDLPLLTGGFTPLPANEADVRHAPARVQDGVQFLSELQRLYFREMRAHLRTIGLRCPVTAVVTNNIAPDVAGVAQECDFTSENWYGEGVGGDPRTPGLRYYSNRNTLRDDSPGGFAPFTAALRWQNKPVVIREWATTWPNTSRAVSVPEALAYASLQDYDAVLLFGYQTNRAPNGALADALNDFAFQSDPTTWGLYALAGQAFLRRAIRPADHTLTLAYPPERLYDWPNVAGDLNRAALSVRLNNIIGEGARSDALVPANRASDLGLLKQTLDAVGRRGAPVSSAAVGSHTWRSDTGQIVRIGNEGRLEINTPTLCVLAGEWTPGRVYSVGRLRFTTSTPMGALFVMSLDGRPLDRSQHLVAKMVSRAENAGQNLEKSPPGAINNWVLRASGKSPVVTLGRIAAHPTRLWFAGSGGQGTSREQGLNREQGTGNREQQKATSAAAPIAPLSPDLITLYLANGTWEMELRDGHATLACDTPGISGLAMGQRFTTADQALELAGLPPLPLPLRVAAAKPVPPKTQTASIQQSAAQKTAAQPTTSKTARNSPDRKTSPTNSKPNTTRTVLASRDGGTLSRSKRRTK